LATQNPIEQSGTFVLPEAQQDRFLLYIKIGYPTATDETAILKATTGRRKSKLNKVISGKDILRLQELVREVTISDGLIGYVSTLIRATRPDTTTNAFVKQWVDWGAGPRAGQAMILTAKAHALMQGRLSVTMEDLQQVALPVLRHRVLMNFRAEAEGITSDNVAQTLLKDIKLND
jgi:MoxR-like ATPase